MSSTSTTAKDVMDLVASLMNDTAKSSYTYAAQMPYLNMALDELQEHFELNNVPVTDETSTGIVVTAGTKEIGPFDGVGSGVTPTYPQDLVEIQEIFERLSGTTNPYIRVVKKEYLPHAIFDLPTEAFQYWSWEGQRIKFIGATTDREIKIDYIKTIFPKVTNEAALLGVANCKSFLMYKTAALCAHFIGENKTRSDELNALAIDARDRVTGIGTKARQNIITRRKPFMAAYKKRSFT